MKGSPLQSDQLWQPVLIAEECRKCMTPGLLMLGIIYVIQAQIENMNFNYKR